MEVLLVLDFRVKSSINDYNVKFIGNLKSIIKNESSDTDIFVVDGKVKDLYPEIFKSIGSNFKIIEIDANENQKSYEGIKSVITDLIGYGFRKNHRLIAIGGGITQDITSFISSILYRGVEWIFFPTTLLAQGDSCIGSKTSINFGEFKNQLGGFYPPRRIYIYSNFLDTLPEKDLQSGFGEMCHYFIVAGEKDFIQYKQDYSDALHNKKILERIISNSLKIKKKYIEIDEFDTNERQIFNYGHSFGHAIESLTNYQIPHGIAVSFGMDMANFVSVKRKILDESIRKDIRHFLKRIWKGYSIANLNPNDFVSALRKDKKNVGKELRLILCKGYGKVFKMPQVINNEFKDWIAEYLKN